MLTVIDIGCQPHEQNGQIEESINQLLDMFNPDRLIGFDPLVEEREYRIDGCDVELHQMAAWTEWKVLTVLERGMCTGVVSDRRTQQDDILVQGFDLAQLILDDTSDEIILKLDCEGAEYPILEHLIKTGADQHVMLTLVEWHDGRDRHDHQGDRDWIMNHFRSRLVKWNSTGGGIDAP